MDQDEGSLIGEAKAILASKVKEFFHYFPLTARYLTNFW